MIDQSNLTLRQLYNKPMKRRNHIKIMKLKMIDRLDRLKICNFKKRNRNLLLSHLRKKFLNMISKLCLIKPSKMRKRKIKIKRWSQSKKQNSLSGKKFMIQMKQLKMQKRKRKFQSISPLFLKDLFKNLIQIILIKKM